MNLREYPILESFLYSFYYHHDKICEKYTPKKYKIILDS